MTEEKKTNQTATMFKNALILFLITLIAGVALGFVYEMTKTEIAVQAAQAIVDANKAVFADATDFNQIYDADDIARDTTLEAGWNEIVAGNAAYAKVSLRSVSEALDANGNVIGYVINVASGGYSSDITFSIGLTNEGHMNGISIISIAESPGLGMEAEPVLVPQFNGYDPVTGENAGRDDMPFTLITVGDPVEHQISAITAATISSRAITSGVNAGYEYFETVLQKGAQ